MALPLLGLLRVAAPQAGLHLVGGALNHMLAQQPDAAKRLAAHADKLICIGLDVPRDSLPSRLLMPDAQLWFRVQADGKLKADRAGDAHAQLLVKPSLKAGADFASGGAANMTEHLRVEGDILLAGLLGELIKDLQWDYEDDLSRVIGDIPARRVGQAVGKAGELGKKAARGAARAVGADGGSDSALLDRQNFDRFKDQVGALRKRVDDLTRRKDD